MPFYDYECKKCQGVQEEMHSMTEKPRIKCNTCKGTCRKLVGSGIVGRGAVKLEIWDYNDIHKTKPKFLKSRDGKTRVRYDPSKHGQRKGRGF